METSTCTACGTVYRYDYYNPADCEDLCSPCARGMVVAPSWDAGIDAILRSK